ncbi:Tetratricopeptide repeat [Sergentomyia squamirostris]
MKRKYSNPKIVNAALLLWERSNFEIEPIVRQRLQFTPQFIKRIELETELRGHNGCVNCLEWSCNGKLLASASDDFHVMIWDAFSHKRMASIMTPHQGNIFSVKFMPKSGNSTVVTGAADGKIYVFDLNRSDSPTWSCRCHSRRVKRLATAPETPFVFWSSAEDGDILEFDLREPHKCMSNECKVSLVCLKNYISASNSVSNVVASPAQAKCLAVNPRRPELIAVGANDCYARMYDRRMMKLSTLWTANEERISSPVDRDSIPKNCVTYFCPGHLRKQHDKRYKAITYLTFSPDGRELLVNMGAEQIYLYDINNAKEPVFLDLPPLHDREIVNSEAIRKKLPEDVEADQKLGTDFLENEKYIEAIYQYTKAIEKAPNCAFLYLNRAIALVRRNWCGDIYAGLRDCHTALWLDPTYLKAHFRLARALLALNYISEASQCLAELKSRFPEYAQSYGVQMLEQDIERAVKQPNSTSSQDGPDLFDLSENEIFWRSSAKDYRDRFMGHCNTTTDIKEANFFGNDANHIIAGSDDGNFFIWERSTNSICEVFNGDTNIVNCVQPHPSVCLLATSGIDHTIKLWSPQPEENFESKHRVDYTEKAMKRNQMRMYEDPFDFNDINPPFCAPS